MSGVRDTMSWCHEDEEPMNRIIVSASRRNPSYDWILACPKCGHQIESFDQGRINGLPGLPAGVKFDPTDHEILEHLEAKIIMEDMIKPHPLIDEFIPTLEGDDGICYTHPEKLPGVGKDGQVRHFFHRPSKAYTTGTRKRRKVHSGPDNVGIETRWHKTGKTRPILGNGQIKGFKKILVLYTNYGRQKKPEKTNWVMHQYHLGTNEEEKDGELVVSKVFFQTQPRQCGATNTTKSKVVPIINHDHDLMLFGDYNDDQSFNGNGKRLLVEYNNNNYDAVINPNHYVYYGDEDEDDRALMSQCLPQLMIPSFAIHSAEDTHHDQGLLRIN